MGTVAPASGSGAPKVDPAEERRKAEADRQKAAAAELAAKGKIKAAENARKAVPQARRASDTARQQKVDADTAAKAARKAAREPGQTPSEMKKSKESSDTAEKNRTEASERSTIADKKLQEAEEKAALAAKSAEESMRKANALAAQECKKPPFSQADIDKVKPTKNELDSAFEGTNRKADLEKLLGFAPPPPREVARKPEKGESPPPRLDAVDAKDAKVAFNVDDGQTYTDPSSGTRYQVRKNATTGETLLSDAASGSSVTIKPDGSYTSTVTAKEATGSGGTRETTWTRSSDAKGQSTGLESRKSQTEQQAETGATTTTSTTRYDTSRSPPRPLSRTEAVRMERPPAALAKQKGVPQGPATVTTETQFNAQGLPTKQVKTTQVQTPGFRAGDVSAFEAGQGAAFQSASKGEDHYRTNNPPASLKPGESSLTITEETRFNAKGEPAVARRKTESVATQALKSDKNGNGVQVVRSQREVTRGPASADSTDALPAVSSRTPGVVNQRTTVTGYDPDGSRFGEGHASRTQTVSQSSGTVDANGQRRMRHQPTEVKSLHEASDNRWRYDHVDFDVGADGKVVPGQQPRQLDKERQLPWYEDAKGFVADELKALADTAGDVADAASDFVTAPLEEALTDEIKKLNSAGDSVSLSGNLDVKVGLKGGISGEAAIERTEDGKYQLSAEVTADVGVGLLGSASVGAGGRMEWKFNTPEDAAKAALTLGKGPSALTPGSEDHAFLRDHLSALEVNVSGEVEGGVKFKAGTGNVDLSASLGATGGLRVEFDKGKPTHLVRTVEFEGTGAAGVATGLKGKADLNVGGEVSGSVSIETKTPLDASKLDGKDVLSFLTGAKSDALAGPSETSITVEGSVDTGDQGQYFTAEVSGLSDKEVQSVTDKLKAGKFENAFDDLKKDAKVTKGTFKDREVGLGAKLVVVDFELNARHRDVTAEGGGGGNGSTTVSLGSGKRRGGSDGPSGGNGATGGPNRSTGNEAMGGTGPSSKTSGNTLAGGDGQPDSTDGAEPSARSPRITTANRESPTQYRVNPLTGHFTPVPPQDGGPSRSGQSKKPGAPGASVEIPPPSKDVQDEKSPTSGPRPVPVVRNPELPGRTTHVRYDDGKVRIEAGPDATPEDIQAHMETARVLQRYEGAMGKVRQLIDKVKQAITGMPGYGSQGFESRLEVQKLSGILQNLEATQAKLNDTLTNAMGKPTPATAEQLEDLERQIASVENQLRTHAAQVDSLTTGRGYVAREDDVTPVTEPDERLPQGVDPWVSDVLPPHIRPRDVVVHEGGLPADLKPNTAYWDGQTLQVTNERREVESVVNPERIRDLPTGVPDWVARAIPPHINPKTNVRVESSRATTGRSNRQLGMPEPNTAYWVDGRYLYVTDSRGRVMSVEGDLHLRKGVRSKKAQQNGNREYLYGEGGKRTRLKVKSSGGAVGEKHLKYRFDEGGHLIGAQFGGPPEFFNYVPQTRYQNGSVTNLDWDPRNRAKGEVPPEDVEEAGPDDEVTPEGELQSQEGTESQEATEESEPVRNWHEFEAHLAALLRPDSETNVAEAKSVRVRIRPQFISPATNRPNEIRVEGLLISQDGEVTRGDWRFGNSSRMDKFESGASGDE
ncbi:DNA/RNA non-specific endonuclease [Myxococcus xanthus]|uniref:DNA/RNA non-specific endonuclease n=1 Tax=Myxococcus xanthus TaxID=34 RepID=UPI0011283BC5|nr:DNA/RNA non-specific endonuclease [Myxococcus xanthus]QDE95943.1 hypothetical protein BHS05_08755 [Myxococcus xanthus]